MRRLACLAALVTAAPFATAAEPKPAVEIKLDVTPRDGAARPKRGLAVSPDGRYVLVSVGTADGEETVFVHRVSDGGRVLAFTARVPAGRFYAPDAARTCAFDPARPDRLVYVDGGELFTRPVAADSKPGPVEPRVVGTTDGFTFALAAGEPAGRVAGVSVSVSRGVTVARFPQASGRGRVNGWWPRVADGDSVQAAQLHPLGRQVAVATRRGFSGPVEVDVYDLKPDGSAPVRRLAPRREPGAWVLALRYSPDGARLAAAGADGNAHVWPADKPGPGTHVPVGATYSVVDVAFLDERHLACATLDPGAKGNLRVVDVTTGKLVAGVNCDARHVQTLDAAPAHKLLATVGSDDTVRLWKFDDLLAGAK